jgi:hypothetical protein
VDEHGIRKGEKRRTRRRRSNIRRGENSRIRRCKKSSDKKKQKGREERDGQGIDECETGRETGEGKLIERKIK